MLTDRHGKGIRIDAVEDVFSASALHYTAQDLYKETHDCNLKPRSEVILSLDAAVLGLGNSSCGPGVLKKYAIDKKEHTLHIRITSAALVSVHENNGMKRSFHHRVTQGITEFYSFDFKPIKLCETLCYSVVN